MSRGVLSRRQLITHGGTAAGALAVGGVGTGAVRQWAEKAQLPPPAPPPGVIDDASALNPTPVRGVLFAESSTRSTSDVVAPLLLRIADGSDPRLAIAGARHSMGGQSLLSGGWVLDTRPMNGIRIDPDNQVMRVGAGATWREVVPALNAAGLSPAVMQSNHDFTIGGSLSVNCHGWQVDRPPVAATVRGLRLLTADGTVVTCDQRQNPELFRLVLGGYGLFGVILDADLAVVPNVRYRPGFASVATGDYTTGFRELVYSSGSRVEMAYGRLSVDPGSFLQEAVIATFVPDPETRGAVLPLKPPEFVGLRRAVFRNSADSGAGKSLRWWLERTLGPWMTAPVSRNDLLNEPAATYANGSPDTTDILHEYFVPQHRLADFVRAARKIIPAAGGNLLNVTVRDVRQDTRSVLRYADQDVFGLVMLFVQERSPAGEERMRALTRALIDAAIAEGGSFYLPYRLHATDAQLRRAYPTWETVVHAKRRYDPRGIFHNELYRRYGPGHPITPRHRWTD